MQRDIEAPIKDWRQISRQIITQTECDIQRQ